MAPTDRIRLDEALVAAGLAKSRSRARDMVLRGTVTVAGAVVDRPALKVAAGAAIAVADPAAAYVSRAALKLATALDLFGFDPRGRTALDLGASTGGFTQVLLECGATAVFAVDVGHDQMDATLAADPRLRRLEGVNARDLSRAQLDGASVDALVCDVSFISLKLALPPALALAEPGSWGVFLVKPQFEVGRAALGKGGIVRHPEAARAAADEIVAWLPSIGWRIVGLAPSPFAGGDGNAEFLLGALKPASP